MKFNNIKYIQNQLSNNVPITPVRKSTSQNLINKNKSEIEKNNERLNFKSVFEQALKKKFNS